MEAFFADLTQLLKDNQMWAGPIVGLISFGESLVIVGLLIPATAVMVVIGGLLGAGVVTPVPVLLGAVVGAVLGDVVSYFLGRWLGPSIVHKWPLNRYRHSVAKTRLFFRKYGFASVFIGRFLGPIRSTVPLVAGMMAMEQKRFQIANVLSACVWAPVMLAPGWLAGRGMMEFDGLTEMHILGLIGLILLATAVGTYFGTRRLNARRPGRVRVIKMPPVA
jgi:membrane protein DedA with SNARE-associated domain